jgi:hypothetical protein
MHRFYVVLFFGISSTCFAMVDHVPVGGRAGSAIGGTLRNSGQDGSRNALVDNQNSLFSQHIFDAIFSDNEVQLSDIIYTMIGQIGVERSLQVMNTLRTDIAHEPSMHNHAYESLANYIAMFTVQRNGSQHAVVNNVNNNKPVVRAASVAAHAVARVIRKKSSKSTSRHRTRPRASIRKKKATIKRSRNSKRHVIRHSSSKRVHRRPVPKSRHVIPQPQPGIASQARFVPQPRIVVVPVRPVPQPMPSYVPPAVPAVQVTRNQVHQQKTQLPVAPAQPVQQVAGSVQRPDRSLQEANRSFGVSPVVQKQEKCPAMQEQKLPVLTPIHAPLDTGRGPVVPPVLSVSRLPEVPAVDAAKLVVADQAVRPIMQQQRTFALPLQHVPLFRKRAVAAKSDVSTGFVPAEIHVPEKEKSVELESEKRPVVQQRGAPALPSRDALGESTYTQEDTDLQSALSTSCASQAAIVQEKEVEQRPVVQQRGAPTLPARDASVEATHTQEDTDSQLALSTSCASQAAIVQEEGAEKRPVVQQRGAPALPERDALGVLNHAQDDTVANEQLVREQQISEQAESPKVPTVINSLTSRVENMLAQVAQRASSDDESDEDSDSEWDSAPLDLDMSDRAEMLTRRVPAPAVEVSVEQQQYNRAQEAAQAEILRERLLARNRAMHVSDDDSDVDAFSD